MPKPTIVLTVALLVASGPGSAQPLVAPELPPVVVTASRTAQAQDDAVVATGVLDREDIEASGARTLAELLEEQGGVQIVEGLRGPEVRMGGLGAEYVLLLVDGQRVVGRVNGAFDLSRIALDDVERVEIVRGPSSALHGADALAGVVQVVTRRARRRPLTLESRASAGTGGRLDLDASAEMAGGDERARVSAGFGRVGPVEDGPADQRLDGTAQVTLAARAIHEPTSASELEARIELTRRDRWGLDELPTGARVDRSVRTESAVGRLGFDGRLGGGARLTGMVAVTLLRDQFLEDQRDADDLDRFEDTSEILAEEQVQLLFVPTDSHIGTVGIDAQTERLSSPRLDHGVGTRQRVGLYAQDEWMVPVSRPLTIALGARLDADTQFGLHATPRMAVRFSPVDALTLRASAGLGYRAPSFQELLLRFSNPGAGYEVEGNPTLRPETSVGLQVGGELRIRRGVVFLAGAYRNHIADLIAFAALDRGSAGGPQRYRYENLEAAVTQGVDLGVRLEAGSLFSIEVQYGLVDATDVERDRPIEDRARHRVSASARMRLESLGVEASTRAAWTGPRTFYVDANGDGRDEAESAAPYATVDARIAKTLGPHFSMFLLGENLLDAGDARAVLRPRGLSAGLAARY